MAESIKKPSFIGQAMLIVLPVLVLLTVGLNSLREDKILARREAVERGQHLADTVVAECAGALNPPRVELREPPLPAFQVDPAGHLLFPPPNATALTPQPLLRSVLTQEQGRLWQQAQAHEASHNEAAAGIEAYVSFLSLHPPAEFVANATYSLGLLMANRGDAAAAVGQFKQVLESQPEAAAESGLPLRPLAALKLLELQTNLSGAERLVSLDTFCSNLVYRPTPLTPALLREAARLTSGSDATAHLREWTQLWEQHERARGLYVAARTNLNDLVGTALSISNVAMPPAFWFTLAAPSTNNLVAAEAASSRQATRHRLSWLAVRAQQTTAACWFRCWTEPQAAAQLNDSVARVATSQDYLGVELRIAGTTVVSLQPSSASVAAVRDDFVPELLASANRSELGSESLKCNVYLTEPARLYAHQRARRWWFGSLIGISAVAALMGLLANWRAFQHQQRLSELKSNFVSSVSHELRTPVAAVQLLVEGLESGKVPGAWKQREYLRLIRQECRRLSALIENILDFSRIEQGRKEFTFEATDVVGLVEQTVKIIEPYAAERKVSLALSIPAAGSGHSHPRPSLDSGAIQQALLNLIDNAIKHSPEDQTVTIGVEWAAHGLSAIAAKGQTGSLALWVEDRGGGIPTEEHQKIFERFYRCGSESRRETQGVGIGLSIVKHVVESHGGRVLVRSAIGRGSRFTIELPLNGRPQKSEL
jgi:signal transduction histidine kinase